MGQHRVNHLTRRDNVYAFRMRLPSKASSRFGKKELKASLKTCDIGEAKLRCRMLTTAFEQLIDNLDAMPELTQEQLKEISQDYFRYLLRCGNEDADLAEIDQLSFEEKQAVGKKRDERISALQHNPPSEEDNVRKWLDKRHIKAANFTDSFSILTKQFAQARLEAEKVAQAKILNDYSKTVSTHPLFAGIMDDTFLNAEEIQDRYFSHLPKNKAFAANEPGTLTKSIEKYIHVINVSNPWSEKNMAEKKRAFKYLTDFFDGETPTKFITSDSFILFLEKLKETPKLMKQLLKTENIKDALAVKTGEHQLLSEGTILKYINILQAYFKWATNKGHYASDPSSDVKLKKVKKSEKKPFTQEELTVVFRSPYFIGCLSEGRRTQAGNLVIQDARYWIFLILAFSGARLGEIVQLTVSDVRNEDGIWIFDVNDLWHEDEDEESSDDAKKSVKTENSKRKFPVHDKLIEFGLLDFVNARKSRPANSPLFYELKSKNPKSAFSKMGNRYLREIGIKDSKLTMHSFRHTFIDACRSNKVDMGHRMEIVGHSEGGMGKVYGHGSAMKALQESINLVRYDFQEKFSANPAGKEIINAA